MPLFRRPGKGEKKRNSKNAETDPLNAAEDEEPLPEIDKETTKKAQDVMKDHLDIMRDVVMKIRHQDGYAKAMYANCPRLQHLLDQNPDLRPVFEDPRLVRINFETVYKEAGGILPEDEEEEERKRNNPSLIMRIANHPIFKFLKVLIFIKKIIGCIAGGGIALVSSCWHCCADCCTDCCCEDAVEEIGEIDEDIDSENEYGLDTEAPLDENQKALNTAADYMEDPEVQEQMQRLLEDPDNLEDAIENDAELRALRDSNPLCAELMQDPETMKILTDPDNLRALGEAPQMIELDFNDPHGFNPQADFVDVEAGEMDGLEGSGEFLDASGSMDGLEAYDEGYDENEAYFPMEDDFGDLQDSALPEDEAPWDDEGLEEVAGAAAEIEMTEAEIPAEQPATSGWEDDFELEQQEVEVDGADNTNADAANKGKGKAQAKSKGNQATTEKKGGMAGVITSFGVAATDVIAAQIVGEVFGADFLPGDLMGGGDMGPDLGGLETAADNADAMVNDDVADLAEDTADDIDDGKDSEKTDANADAEKRNSHRMSIDSTGRKQYVGLMGASAAAAAAAASLGPMKDDEDDSIDDGLESINGDEPDERFEDEEEGGKSTDEEEDGKPKSTNKVFGAFKNLASATVTAAKETMAGALLGDDLAEMLVEKQEEMAEASSDEEDEKDKKKKRRFRLFGRKKNDEDDDFDVDGDLGKSFRIGDLAESYSSFRASNPALTFEPNEDELYDSNLAASIPIPDYTSSFNMSSGDALQYNSSTTIPSRSSLQYQSSASTSIPSRSSLNASIPIPEYAADFTFPANEDEEEYDPNFYKSNPEYTFEANEDEEEYDPNFYEANPEYTASPPTSSNKLDIEARGSSKHR